MLRSENTGDGIGAGQDVKVTVAKDEEGKPQTVSKNNGHDWCTYHNGEVSGIPQEKISRDHHNN